MKTLLKRIFRKRIRHNEIPYLQWLQFANAGMFNHGNAYCVEYAIKNLPSDDPVLEIGSFCGLSTNVMTYFLEKYHHDNKVITSDCWEFESNSESNYLGDSNIEFSEYRDFIIDSFKRNLNFFSRDRLPYAIELNSDQFFENWDNALLSKDVFDREIQLGGKFSFGYVDGNHSYEFVKRDFDNLSNNLVKGGFIFFDDSSDGLDFGSSKLMEEVKSDERFRLVLKNPNYLFQKIQ